MEKHEIGSNDEILDNIKKIILSRHPIIDDRLAFLLKSKSSMDININFYNEHNGITNIMFLDGTDNYKSSIPEQININNLIDINTINEIIIFLISDHDTISSIYKTETEINLKFVVNLKDEISKGISCCTFGLSLDFYGYDNHEEILNKYFKSIVSTFINKLTHTSWYQQEYTNYINIEKTKIINSLSEENLKALFDLLTNEDRCEMLLEMPNERFAEIYNELTSKQKNLVKKHN